MASFSRDLRSFAESAGSASEFVTVSSGFDEAVVVGCVSGTCADSDAGAGAGTGVDSGLGSMAGVAAAGGFGTDASFVGVDDRAGVVVDMVDLGGASTLRLTCFSFTIVMRLDPKSADPSIFEKRVLTYSTSRSKLRRQVSTVV